MSNTCKRIETLLRAHSGVGASFAFNNETTLKGDIAEGGLSLDSLDIIETAIKLEEEFGIEISDDDVDSPALGTLGGLCAYVEGKLATRAASYHVPSPPTVANAA